MAPRTQRHLEETPAHNEDIPRATTNTPQAVLLIHYAVENNVYFRLKNWPSLYP